MRARVHACLRVLSLNIMWAGPGGTAIPGQPVRRAGQAQVTSSIYKNQFNIESGLDDHVSDIKLIRTDTTL